jgi:hypothetical protein
MTTTTADPSLTHTAAQPWAVQPDAEHHKPALYSPEAPSIDPEVSSLGRWRIRPAAPEQADAPWAKLSAAVAAVRLEQGTSSARLGTHHATTIVAHDRGLGVRCSVLAVPRGRAAPGKAKDPAVSCADGAWDDEPS